MKYPKPPLHPNYDYASGSSGELDAPPPAKREIITELRKSKEEEK